MQTLAHTVTTTPADPVPEDDDVVAGPWGAVMFAFLIVATALLLWSFTRQLRKAQAAKDAGVYGDPPAERESEGEVELSDAGSDGGGDDGGGD
jgi:hypothetical protein